MALVPNERDHFQAKISCRLDWDYLKDIRENLHGRNKKKFKESCFGQFWDMGKLQFQGQLLLHLLLRQDTSGSLDKIVFHINDKEAEFGMNEFALITGLHFGRKPDLPSHSTLHKDIFGGETDLKLKDIQDAFHRLAIENNGRGDTVLKMALLYMLYGVLLVKQRTSKRIDVQYIHLADNLEEFNAYPWGRVTFEFVMNVFRDSMRKKVEKLKNVVEGEKMEKSVVGAKKKKKSVVGGKKKKKEPERLEFTGFTPVLQLWAYEVMPDVARLCATRRENMEGKTPRMLRWAATSIPKTQYLKSNVFLSSRQQLDHAPVVVLPKLEASVEESNQPFYQSLVEWQRELEKMKSTAKKMTGQKRKRNFEQPLQPKRMHKKEERTKRRHDSQESSKKMEKRTKRRHDSQESSKKMEQTSELQMLSKKVDKLEKMLIGIMKKLDCKLPSDSDEDWSEMQDDSDSLDGGESDHNMEDDPEDDPMDDPEDGPEDDPLDDLEDDLKDDLDTQADPVDDHECDFKDDPVGVLDDNVDLPVDPVDDHECHFQDDPVRIPQDSVEDLPEDDPNNDMNAEGGDVGDKHNVQYNPAGERNEGVNPKWGPLSIEELGPMGSIHDTPVGDSQDPTLDFGQKIVARDDDLIVDMKNQTPAEGNEELKEKKKSLAIIEFVPMDTIEDDLQTSIEDDPKADINIDELVAGKVLSCLKGPVDTDDASSGEDVKMISFVDIVTPEKGEKALPEEMIYHRRRVRKPGPKTCSPWTDPTRYNTPHDIPRQQSSSSELSFYNPSGVYPNDMLRRVEEWWLKNKDDRGRTIQLPLPHLGSVHISWFDSLIHPDGWLSNEHVDALINLLIYKRNKWPQCFSGQWTCTETLFWNLLNPKLFGRWERAHRKKNPNWKWWDEVKPAMEYIIGELPLHNGQVAWAHCDAVYGVAHIFRNHWVMYELNIEQQEITVYDSLSMNYSKDRTERQFRKLARMLPEMCEQANVWRDRKYHGVPKAEWTVNCVQHPPQQTNSSDCGIMVIKFVECLAAGRSVASVDPQRGLEFRQRCVAELLHPDNIMCTL